MNEYTRKEIIQLRISCILSSLIGIGTASLLWLLELTTPKASWCKPNVSIEYCVGLVETSKTLCALAVLAAIAWTIFIWYEYPLESAIHDPSEEWLEEQYDKEEELYFLRQERAFRQQLPQLMEKYAGHKEEKGQGAGSRGEIPINQFRGLKQGRIIFCGTLHSK